MIFCFSGTGNTRWVASQLADATGENLVDIAAEMLVSAKSYILRDDERLGFCFPTHGWQPPRLVREFIRRTTFSVTQTTYCFALTTCGDSAGRAMSILNKELAAKGLHADATFSVIMPESYVCLPFMYTDSPEREASKIATARQRTADIAEIVSSRQRGVEMIHPGFAPRIYSYVIGAYFNKKMIRDTPFTVDTDKCISCGKCAKVCPVENIAGYPPEWQHNGRCTCCLACYHYCPTHAINYGRRTLSRGQYHMKETGHST